MKSIRLLIIQLGDYRASMEARDRGEPETYRAQYHSMDVVERLAAQGQCLVICLDTEPYDVVRKNFRLVSGRFMPKSGGFRFRREVARSSKTIIRYGEEFNPSHIIIRAPGWVMEKIGGWAINAGMQVLPVFADIFYNNSLKDRLKNHFLVRLLNDSRISLVANHNYPACWSMVEAGVKAKKVVPYDWPPVRNPKDSPAKSLVQGDSPISLLYAGAVSEAKGVGDLIEAVRHLGQKGLSIRLEVCGAGPKLGSLKKQAEEYGLREKVVFNGMISNIEVLEKMRATNLVVVPSRHEYPEGLPNVIYEGFETRTPVICSDHPTFVMRLTDGTGCRIFPARNPVALATAVEEAVMDPETYASLSRTTLPAWEGIQCPVTFEELLKDWMSWACSEGDLSVLNNSLGNYSDTAMPRQS